MEKIKKRNSKYLTWFIILIVIVIAMIIIFSRNGVEETPKHIAQCVGEKATLYVRFGCSHCEDQEKMFGENIKYIQVVDCWYEMDKCGSIEYTPTWIIDGKKYIGVQSIERLRELTNC